MDYNLRQMDRDHAVIISKWVYEDPYSIYSMDGSEDCINEFLNGFYSMVKDMNENLIGYFCFGVAARVPVGNLFGAYEDNEFTDIGLGIKPGLCGQGLGADFMSYGLDYGRRILSAKSFRLTVASFNVRAVKVYERLGFRRINSFVRESEKGVVEFLVMILD